jgi:hypothetical protein
MSDQIVRLYMSQSEFWENNPQEYVKAFQVRRDAFEETLYEVDHAAMVASWSDDTLFSVQEAGTDLAFNSDLAESINAAVDAEVLKRRPAAQPTGHGMQEDGTQQTGDE